MLRLRCDASVKGLCPIPGKSPPFQGRGGFLGYPIVRDPGLPGRRLPAKVMLRRRRPAASGSSVVVSTLADPAISHGVADSASAKDAADFSDRERPGHDARSGSEYERAVGGCHDRSQVVQEPDRLD